MNKQIKHIHNWNELISFLNNMNYYQKTIVLCGWFQEHKNGKNKIKSLLFKTVELKNVKDQL